MRWVSIPHVVCNLFHIYLFHCNFQGTFIFSLVKYTPLKFNNTLEYPWWGYALGWWFTLSSTLMVPFWMLYNLSTTPGTLRQVSYLCMNINFQKTVSVHLLLKPIFFFVRGSPSYVLQPKTSLWPNQRKRLLNCLTCHHPSITQCSRINMKSEANSDAFNN